MESMDSHQAFFSAIVEYSNELAVEGGENPFDLVKLIGIFVKTLSDNANYTHEEWEILKQTANNVASIFGHLIDEEQKKKGLV